MPEWQIRDKIRAKGQVVTVNWNDISNDQLLKGVVKAILEEEQGVSVSNLTREEEFETCEELIHRLFDGKGYVIRAIPHDDLPSVGTIEVSGKGIRIDNPYLFGAAASLAHNYEFYSKLDGTVVLNLTFYNMTLKI